MKFKKPLISLLISVTFSQLICFSLTFPLQAADFIFPAKPASTTFIVDEANLISPSDHLKIDEIIKTTFQEKDVPIYVVTIPSLSNYGGRQSEIEIYANSLFNKWGIGHRVHNYGILLLIAKEDRKARIQLGASWNADAPIRSKEVMDRLIIPKFKSGDFSTGILNGVQGLQALAKGESIPTLWQLQWWFKPFVFIFGGVGCMAFYSLIRSGRKGIGWTLLVATLGLAWLILKLIVNSDPSDSDSGFDGGFSGGGGATGSW